jgi:hypothetical protein
MTLVSFFAGPVLACGLGGLLWGTASALHVVLAAAGVFLPTLLHEADYVAGLGALAGLVLADGVSLLVGGATAALILLRWPRGPTTARVFTRYGSGLPTMRGVDLALALNLLATAAATTLLAPIVGAASYVALSYWRGNAEEEAWRQRVSKAKPPAHPGKRAPQATPRKVAP